MQQLGCSEHSLLCRMMVHSGMLTEVLGEWGLLELLLGELRRRAKIIRKAGVASSPQNGTSLNMYFPTFVIIVIAQHLTEMCCFQTENLVEQHQL